MRDCLNCYFFKDNSGVYGERNRCKLGFNMNKVMPCLFIDKEDKVEISKYEIKECMDRLVDGVRNIISTELTNIKFYTNKLLK